MNDLSLWEELKKTIVPLAKRGINAIAHKELPPRLRVRRVPAPEISYTLNLHGMTVAESYDAVKKFLVRHQNLGSKKVTVITGKGLKRVGAIKKEIILWFDTPVFKDKIASYSWKNDGGALDIVLKRIKK